MMLSYYDCKTAIARSVDEGEDRSPSGVRALILLTRVGGHNVLVTAQFVVAGQGVPSRMMTDCY